MKTSARSRFWIRETGKASINGHMPSKSRETKEKGGPVPPAHMLSIPPVPDSSGVSSHCPATISRPPPRELPPRELAPWAQAIHAHGSSLVALSSPLGPRSATRGKGENGVWRGSRKTEPPPRDKKNPLSNGRIATVLRGLQRPWRKAPLPPFACLGNPAEEGPLSQPRNPARNRPRRRRCCSGCSGEMDSSSEDRQTQLSKNRERGVQGSSPAPPNPHPTSPQCDPDTQFARSSLTRPSTGYCVWILSLPFVVLK